MTASHAHSIAQALGWFLARLGGRRRGGGLA